MRHAATATRGNANDHGLQLVGSILFMVSGPVTVSPDDVPTNRKQL